jgi:cyclopropane-fatty-acyl-phospholipid synthase
VDEKSKILFEAIAPKKRGEFMKSPSFSAQIFMKLLKKSTQGLVEVTYPTGQKEIYGEGQNTIHVHVQKWEVLDLLFTKGDLGLAEAIIEGDLVVDDVAGLVEWACRNDQMLAEAFHGKWYGVLAQKLRHLLAWNSRAGAKQNIISHYDLGNEFYRLWLDPTMTYSSAIYSETAQDLESAQNKKYDRLIEGLNIKSGDHVLEIGCGWGGFFSRAVEKTGCKVTAVMNSPEQARHNAKMIQQKGYTSNVTLKEIDYRDIEGKFDKIVSIEMIEAVGEKYWGTYFEKVGQSLNAKGSAMIQGITIREDLFYGYRKGTDFIQQYVFPGGMLLTNNVFKEKGAENNLNLTDTFHFSPSYAQTLKTWRENFRKARSEVLAMGFDDKFIRMWELYLSYCEGAFRAGRIGVGQFLLER